MSKRILWKHAHCLYLLALLSACHLPGCFGKLKNMKVEDEFSNGLRFVGLSSERGLIYHSVQLDSHLVKTNSKLVVHYGGKQIAFKDLSESTFSNWRGADGEVNGMKAVRTSEAGSSFKVRLDDSVVLQIASSDNATLEVNGKKISLPAEGEMVTQALGAPVKRKSSRDYR